MSKIIITIYVLTTALALILMKLGSVNGAPISFNDSRVLLNLNIILITAGVLYVTSFLLYTYLISKFDLGYIIPLGTGLVYILIFVASFIIFKESFTALKITAIALILVGLVLLQLGK